MQITFRVSLCGKCHNWGCSLLSRSTVRCDLELGSQLEVKAFTAAWKVNTRSFLFCLFLCVFCFVFQEEVKAFQNSSEKQKSLMSSWCWVLFSLSYKISMSNALMKIIHCPNYPDLQEEQKHLYRKTFLYNLPRKMYHVSGLVWMKSQVFKNFQNRFTSPPTSFVLII